MLELKYKNANYYKNNSTTKINHYHTHTYLIEREEKLFPRVEAKEKK